MRRNTRITKKREGGERGGGGLSESRAQSSFAKLESKRHSSLDCRKLLFIKLHSTYSPAAPTMYVFATVHSTHLTSMLSREHRQLKQVKHLILPLENRSARSDRKKENINKKMFAKTYLRKSRCTDDKHDHRKARGQAIPNLPALAP